MADNAYNPHRTYDDTDYTIAGNVLNKIGKEILKLEQIINDSKADEMKQEIDMLRIRDKNPAVKDAWDKYQTVLGLASK